MLVCNLILMCDPLITTIYDMSETNWLFEVNNRGRSRMKRMLKMVAGCYHRLNGLSSFVLWSGKCWYHFKTYRTLGLCYGQVSDFLKHTFSVRTNFKFIVAHNLNNWVSTNWERTLPLIALLINSLVELFRK